MLMLTQNYYLETTGTISLLSVWHTLRISFFAQDTFIANGEVMHKPYLFVPMCRCRSPNEIRQCSVLTRESHVYINGYDVKNQQSRPIAPTEEGPLSPHLSCICCSCASFSDDWTLIPLFDVLDRPVLINNEEEDAETDRGKRDRVTSV